MATLGSVLGLRLDCGFTRRRFRGRTAKLPDGGKHYPPMPEQYANVLQVLIGQMAERRDTNSVFSRGAAASIKARAALVAVSEIPPQGN
jgi:hypothetical protein